MARPPSTTLSKAQKRVLEAVLRREQRRLPNFVSDLVADLALKAESSLGATLQRMVRLGVILLQGGGVQGRQRLVVPTDKGRILGGMGAAAAMGAMGAMGSTFSGGKGGAHGLLLPLFGTIPAGPLEEVVARAGGEVEAVEVGSLLNPRAGDFLLRIKGDSMVGDGIFEGDLVLLRPDVALQQGEIAAVIVQGAGADCDATLKRVFRRTALKARSESAPHPLSDRHADHDWENASADSVEGFSEEGEGYGGVLLRASNPAYADLVLPAESVRIAGVFRGLIRPSGPRWGGHSGVYSEGGQ